MDVNPFLLFILDGDPLRKINDQRSGLIKDIFIFIPDDSVLDFLYEDLGIKNFSELASIPGLRDALIYSSVFFYNEIKKEYFSYEYFLDNPEKSHISFKNPDIKEIDGIKILREEIFPRKQVFKFPWNRRYNIYVKYIEGLLLTDEANSIINTDFVLPFGNMPLVENPSYRGHPNYAVLEAEFLRILHKEDCIAITSYWDPIFDSWADIGIEVRIENDKIIAILLTSIGEKHVFDCLKSNSDFSIIYLTLSYYEQNGGRSGGHANMLIYNRSRREIERFEPHGYSSTEGTPQLDTKLKEYFENPQFKKYIDRYLTPKDICPTMPKLFQVMELQQKNQLGMKSNGWCQSWSMWYAHLRLSNKTLSQNIVIKRAMDELQRKPRGFIDLARTYHTFLEKFSSQLGESYDSKVFEEMLKHYKIK